MSCDLKKTAWSFLFDAKSIVRKGDFTYQNPAVLMEFAERSAAMAQKILTDGIPDYNTLETKAPGLKKIIEKTFESELKKGKLVDIEALNAYLTAGSSLVRQNLGHLSNVPTDAALKLINDGSNYARAAREIGGFLDEYLDRKVERGLWSKEGSSASREKYAEFYAPLKRVVDVVFSKRHGRPLPKGFNPISTDKRVKGGGLQFVIPPIDSIVENVIGSERAIANNEAMKALSNMLKKDGYAVEKVNLKKLTPKELAEALATENIKVSESDVIPFLDGINNYMLDMYTGAIVPGEIRWMENGEHYRMAVPDNVYEIANGLEKVELGKIERVLSKTKSFVSQSITMHPGTAVRLGILDTVVGFLQTKHGKASYLANLPKAMYEVFFGGEAYKRYQNTYPIFHGDLINMADVAKTSDALLESVAKKKKAALGYVAEGINAIKKIWGMWRQFNLQMSDVSRVNEFIRSEKAARKRLEGLGLDEHIENREAWMQASIDAAEVSVPYGRVGSSQFIQYLAKLMPFAGTAISSSERFFSSLDPRTKQGRANFVAAMAITAPTLYFYLMNRGDPRYLRETDRDRAAYVYIYTKTPEEDPNEEPIRIRKLWQWGWMFQTLPELMVDTALGDKKEGIKNLKSLMSSFEFEFSPITMSSIVDSVKGGSFEPQALLSGRYSMVPSRYGRLDPEYQFKPDTTETAKLIAKSIGIIKSPLVVEGLITGLGARFGKDALNIMDEILIKAGIAPDSKKGRDLADHFFFGTWFGRGVGKSSSHLERFWEIYNEEMARNENYRKLIQSGLRDEAIEYSKKQKFIPQGQLNKARNALKRYSDEILRLEYQINKTPSDREKKRQRIRELELEMHKQAESVVKILERARG